VPAAAHVRFRLRDRDPLVGGHEIAGLSIAARRVALPHPHLAREDERLSAASAVGQPAIDHELVEANA
jgi:hypothetical protein